MKNILTILILGIIIVFSCKSSAISIHGKIALMGKGDETCLITINSIESRCNEKGRFSVEVKRSEVYTLRVVVRNHFPIIQTFSDYELGAMFTKSNKEPNKKYAIPTIYPVQKIEGRTMFAFAGDVMMGRRYSKPYFNDPVLIGDENKLKDTKAIVQHMKPYLELADFSALNLETQISDVKPTKRAQKGVTFFSPPETLGALKWAGIDYVTLGNNHIYDYLDEGLINTLNFLEKSGLGYSGAGKDQAQALEPFYANLAGHQYAMLGYVGWTGSANPNQVAEEKKGGSAYGTEGNIAKAVAEQQKNGRPTVVQYHGSLEYGDEPSGMTESRLKMAIDEGADLVIAHHPHVTQGFEIYKGKLIAYSMGNFIFDQNFHVTPLSYVLYVWMDGEKFHRVEIVPIYIKGYVPVPATGIQRSAIAKRVTNLTERRNLSLTNSGGHLILEPKNLPQKSSSLSVILDRNSRITDLYRFPIKRISNIRIDNATSRYRLGKNQLNGGDFESYNLFSSPERGWKLDNAKVSIKKAYSGKNSVEVNMKNSKCSIIGMKTFRRVFKPGNPMSFSAKILNKLQPIKVKLFLQKRKKRAKFFDAFKSERILLSEKSVTANNDWQSIEFDFNLPRVGYRSYRIVMELSYESESSKVENIYVDDVALIEWQAHFNEWNELPRDVNLLTLATHIGFENNSKDVRKIIFETRN